MMFGKAMESVKQALSGSRGGGVALIAMTTVVALLATLYRGIPIADVELHDGGVWVTNGQQRLVGHLNYPSRILDGGLAVTAEAFDVHQSGNDVLAKDLSTLTAALVDTSLFLLGSSGSFAADLDVSYGASTVAVTELGSGKVWVMDAQAIGSFSREADPLLEVKGARAVATHAGDVLVVAPSGEVQIIARQGRNFAGPERHGEVKGYRADAARLVLSAVGDQVVVLDQATNELHLPKGTMQLPGTDELELQSASARNDVVVLASPTELIYAPLDGSEKITAVSAGGTSSAEPGQPVQPVFFQGCVYGAWLGTGNYLRDCPGEVDDDAQAVPRIASASEMAFRWNRDVIVLNDLITGLVLLVNEQMIEVDNWNQVQASLESEEEQTDSDEDFELGMATDPENNTPPVANPDTFGVRPGRTVWLPVLANDEDPDGDILTAAPSSQPTMGPVQQVSKGEALQIVVPDDAAGTDTFTYEAQDGRGGTSEAQVSLQVRDWALNEAPKPLRKPKLTISQTGSISYNVLNDWYDPDGDIVYLVSAGPADDTAVESRPDGTVTIRDLGTADPGIRPVVVTMTDGRETATYEIQLDVRQGNRNLPPLANSDHVSAVVGQSVTVLPLANDTDPNGDHLRLVSVAPAPGVHATADYAAGTVQLTGEQAGTQYVGYTVSDNKAEATGQIRLDVLDPGNDGQPPAAMPDIALLPPGGTALVDLTVNDTDPMGGVLVVQSIELPRDSGLSVQLIDHNLARVTAPAGLEGEARFSYTISNGYGTAQGSVLVVGLPAESTDQPPTAVDDTATVRAGDITTVDVMLNDISPAHLGLSVDPVVTITTDNPGAVAFVSGDGKLRFRAGPDAGTARVIYTVRDTNGGFASATAVITIVAADAQNNPPNPQPLYGRTFAGTPVRIAVPTAGSDPDGDSVTLTGLDAPAPLLGSVTISQGYLEYTPNPQASGTETFGYQVTDRFGAVGRSVVRVGVSPLPTVNQAPFAIADTIDARPGRLLSVPVTANDIDPDGDQVTLMDGSVQPVDASTVAEVTVENNRVELTTPNESGTLRYYYDISDGRGGTARGVLTVVVSEEAPLLSPIARDDAVSLEQIFDQDAVSVDVLINDEDPDGASKELDLSTTDPGATVTSDRLLEVQVGDQRQVVVYTITDPDGLSAKAALVVPGRLEQRPILDTKNIPVHVVAEEPTELRLADYVRVRSGRSPQLTFAETVTVAVGGDGSEPVKDATTLLFTSAEGFLGETSIQFEVTDGSGPDDLDGLTAVLSLPIIVDPNPDENQPPEVFPSEVTVAAGEDAKRVDLGGMIKDPDDPKNEKIKVSLLEASEPFKVSLDGLALVVSAPVDAAVGTPGTAIIEVSDGKEQVSAAIPLRVVSSTRPLLSISPITISDAKAGQPSQVDLGAYVTNPFAAEGKPFSFVGQPGVTLGQGTASASGTSLTIIPAEGFNGQMSVGFRLADATNDPAREVSGTVALTVRDKPGAPVNVVATSTVSKTAEVSWQAGAANGSPITGFTVNWTGDNGSTGSTTVGQVTATTVSGLTNNVWYTFTVVATNEVGDSPASAASNQVRPDTKPNQVGTPTAKFGDQQIDVSWPIGTTEGAPIDHYEVTISPAPGGVSVQEVAGTSLTWTGLANGTAYSFTVVAVSVNNLSSDPSAASAPEVPAGAPAQPGAPSVVKDPAGPMAPSANISWAAPDANGDAAGLTYEVRQSGGGNVCSGTATSCRIEMAVASTNQTFEVRATNKSQKWSEWSPVSNAIRPFQPPSAVTGLSATPTGQNNSVRIDFTPGALNGATSNEIEYHWQAGGASGTLTPGQTITNSAFPNGTNVSLSVYPVATVNGERSQGDSTGPVNVNAYGPPRAPSVSARGNVNDVTVSWNASGAGNGRSIVEVETNTGAGKSVSGEQTLGNGRDQTHCISARAKDETGQWGDWSGQQCASTWGQPSWRFSLSGERYQDDYLLNVQLSSYNPNSTVRCSYSGTGGRRDYDQIIAVDGNGNFGPAIPRVSSGTAVSGGAPIAANQATVDDINRQQICRQN